MARDLRARNGRQNRHDLADFVQGLPEPNTLLGLTHVTSGYWLREIIADGCIQAHEHCAILGEPVTYAFYGRAAFRGKSDFEPTTFAFLFPIVLILDPNKVPPPKYVFGFDSGAFVSGMMDKYLHPYMPLFDFMLAPTPISAARLINAVFESNEQFFLNRPSHLFSVPAANYEAECYRRIVMSATDGQNQLDDRASTPELIFADKIDLRDCVRAAIIPDTLATEQAIGGRLKSHGVEIHEYRWVSGSRPVENHFVIRQLIQSVYEAYGWL